MRILGIDPGTKVTGFGIIEQVNRKIKYVISGQITSKATQISERLNAIYEGVVAIANEYNPVCVAIEQAFAYKNMATAIILGQARGVAMVAASRSGIAVFEYAPRKIKKAVVGYGNADKLQVQEMVKALLCLSEIPGSDAADALAVAICHSNSI